MARPPRAAGAAKPRTTAKKAPAKPKAVKAALDFHIAKVYHELKSGDGVIRVEAGHYVVTTPAGVSVMPPERFAEAYPEHAG